MDQYRILERYFEKIYDLDISPYEKLLLFFIAIQIGARDCVQISRRDIADGCSLAKPTVNRKIRAMKQKGLIEVIEVLSDDGGNEANIYKILI